MVTVEARAWTLADASDACRRFTKQRASNFYYAFASLPRRKRNAIYAAYAFAGIVDDAVDEAGSAEERMQRLNQTRARLERAYAAGSNTPTDDWLVVALGDAVHRYEIPIAYFHDLIAGMEQDLTQRRYATFAELEAYCYRAAAVIGLICAEIFGYERTQQDRARAAAIAMGKALQLTNILRDVAEDASRDRIYLAQEDLQRFGYSEQELLTGVSNNAFRTLMAEYARRAEAWYDSGEQLLPLLDGARSRMCCNGIQGVYRAILREIVKRNYNVFQERISPSSVGRLLLLFRLWIGGVWLGMPRLNRSSQNRNR